ncbi:MAG: hypothetical protein MJZ81_09635 [Bacteroidales bacterium]|nr:hypothetical protein [Bacteroidales bacterium]
MRCTFKVAYRNGLTQIERRTPYFSGDDGKATVALMNDLLDAWEKYETGISEYTKEVQTKKAVNSVNRAFRFDSWVYVGLEVRGFVDKSDRKYRMKVGITMSDPNRVDEDVLVNGRKVARELAELILVRREISIPELKERICYDSENEFFKFAEASDTLKVARDKIREGDIKVDTYESIGVAV